MFARAIALSAPRNAGTLASMCTAAGCRRHLVREVLARSVMASCSAPSRQNSRLFRRELSSVPAAEGKGTTPNALPLVFDVDAASSQDEQATRPGDEASKQHLRKSMPHTVVRHPPAEGYEFPTVPPGCEAKFAIICLGNTQYKVMLLPPRCSCCARANVVNSVRLEETH